MKYLLFAICVAGLCGCSHGRSYTIQFNKSFTAKGIEVDNTYSWKTKESIVGDFDNRISGNISGRKPKEFISALEKLNFLYQVEPLKKAEEK